MLLRTFINIRKFSTARVLCRPAISSEYKSKDLWEDRYHCKIISDNELIKKINNKIVVGDQLNHLETDIFINIAAAETEGIDQLRETVKTLEDFRRTLYAHHQLPSTNHAVCRLFLESERLPSLVNLIEKRVDYGIFPDPYALNLILDESLETKNYALASRIAAHIMLQEDFGQNYISDILSLYSVSKYVESKVDFKDWITLKPETDPILVAESKEQQDSTKSSDGVKEKQQVEDEEDEDDAEYIRVPFLRNPYFDHHFDLTNPRAIVGTTLTMLGKHFTKQDYIDIGHKSQLLGAVLQGRWNDAIEFSNKCKKSNISVGSVKELCKFYSEELHDIDAPLDEQKSALISSLDNLSDEGKALSDEAETKSDSFQDVEVKDIDKFKNDLLHWSELRQSVKRTFEEREERKRLIEEIKEKKKSLKLREQYLYFYDALKKKSLTRIEYK